MTIDRTQLYPSLDRVDPRLDTLTVEQIDLWARLVELPPDIVLYGGTALAMRLGHRASVDFDFFVPRAFPPGEMRRSARILENAEPIQTAVDTLVVRVEGIRVAIYGVVFPSIVPPDLAADTGIPIASPADLGATKVKSILDRAESKDYIDISSLLEAGADLADMLGGATALFGRSFDPMLALKALTSFEDGDLPSLPDRHRERIRAAARSVTRIPVIGTRMPAILPQAVVDR